MKRSRDLEGPRSKDEVERRDGAEVSVRARVGGGALGAGLTALGSWILPYQWERGNVMEALVGAGLVLLGLFVVVGAVRGRPMAKRAERAVEWLGELLS